MMFRIALFEIRQHARSPSTYIIFSVFFLVTFILLIKTGGAFAGASGQGTVIQHVWLNGTWNLYRTISILSILSLIVVANLMGKAVQKDFHEEIFPLIFTTGVSRHSYLLGRFFGVLAVLGFITAGVGAGAYAAAKMPFLDAEVLGPNRLEAYLRPYLLSVWPNIFFAGALFFALGAISRKMLPVYTTGVLLLVGYSIGTEWMESIDMAGWATLLDPFGYAADLTETRIWTIAEKNARVMPLSFPLLANRLLWCGAGMAAILWTLHRFRMMYPESSARSRESNISLASVTEKGRINREIPSFDTGQKARAFAALVMQEFKAIAFRPSFVLIMLSAILFTLAMSVELGSYLGTPSYPMTYAVIEILGKSFFIFVLIVTVFFSGEMIWRERDNGMHQICDAAPVSNAVRIGSKTCAASLILLSMLTILMICSLLIQLYHGYMRFEIGQYLLNFYVFKMMEYLPIWIFGMFVHTVVNRKSLGHLIMLMVLIAAGKVDAFGFEHYMYRLFRLPRLMYSDINGYGPFLKPFIGFGVYWMLFACLLAAAVLLLWVRGTDTGFRARLRKCYSRITPSWRLYAAGTGTMFAVTGAIVVFNTMWLNTYSTHRHQNRDKAAYELTYSRFNTIPQPRVASVAINVELFPARELISVEGTCHVVNRSSSAITQLMAGFPAHLFDADIRGNGQFPIQLEQTLDVSMPYTAVEQNERFGTWIFTLAQPMLPGQSADLNYRLKYRKQGFPNGPEYTRLVANGTFIDSTVLCPHIGFCPLVPISSDRVRHRFGLPDRKAVSPPDDQTSRWNTYLCNDADRIRFEAVIGTSADQVALAPGECVEQWEAGGRRYFRYRPQTEIWKFFAVVSGSFHVIRDMVDGIAIEIYHHPEHTYNLETMRQACRDTLTYCSRHYGAYPHHTLRIVEVPRYNGFAQSFATLIPFSEAIGFTAKVEPDDEKDVNYPYYVTAHEVAHQWWAHAVCSADTLGASVVTETLASYTADLLMEKRFGEPRMKRYRRLRLDEYLTGRSNERREESPLILSDNGQSYIHYRKGQLVMNAVYDLIGEDAVNRALHRFAAAYAGSGPPYPTALELVDMLIAETPVRHRNTIREWFEKIVLYDLRMARAEYHAVPEGGYDVVCHVEAHKSMADGLGNDRQAEVADRVDAGLFDAAGNCLIRDTAELHTGDNLIRFHVDSPPARAGIDPYITLIDRNPEDNFARAVLYKPFD